jgi:hypothetical protein
MCPSDGLAQPFQRLLEELPVSTGWGFFLVKLMKGKLCFSSFLFCKEKLLLAFKAQGKLNKHLLQTT